MLYAPSLRRFFVPSLICLALVVLYRLFSHSHVPHVPHIFQRSLALPPSIRIPLSDLNQHVFPFRRPAKNHLSPALSYHYTHHGQQASNSSNSTVTVKLLEPLQQCPMKANKYTGHARLTNSSILNISLTPPDSLDDTRIFFNPTIIALPPWSSNQYIIVARIITNGLHQENVLCEANICYTGPSEGREKWEIPCTADDMRLLASQGGGMRCATKPILLNVPPTPAEKCIDEFEAYPDIPGFHDPRVFWSGKGEPLMMANSHMYMLIPLDFIIPLKLTGSSMSRYACFGLWLIDLRTLYPPLQTLTDNATNDSPESPLPVPPLMSYPTLTELTRNPPHTRGPIEKNWMYFSAGPSQASYIQYEIAPQKRTFAKLLGNGLTSENLTSPTEPSCIEPVPRDVQDLPSAFYDPNNLGSWHQTSNSLYLILCRRTDENCKTSKANTVFFAAIQRKLGNEFGLPMRYERYFVLWEASPPFGMLAMSRHPLLFANESASNFPAGENWDGDEEQLEAVGKGERGKDLGIYFTYTVSVSYVWGREEARYKEGKKSYKKEGKVKGNGKGKERMGLEEMQVGYLDDEVVVGVGLEDKGMGYAVARVEELLQCLKMCPGVG